MPKKVRIATNTLYRDWEEYLQAFCAVGGVIEAGPSCLPSFIGSPSIGFFIEPDGNVEIVGSFDRVNGKECVNIGCFYPQTSLPNMVRASSG